MTNTELRNIGQPAQNSGIRQVQGNASDARTFFNNQVNPSTVKEVSPGVFVGQNSSGVTFTLKAKSSGLSNNVPTIDVNGVMELRKIKFTDVGLYGSLQASGYKVLSDAVMERILFSREVK